jgi:hypothetical protein
LMPQLTQPTPHPHELCAGIAGAFLIGSGCPPPTMECLGVSSTLRLV